MGSTEHSALFLLVVALAAGDALRGEGGWFRFWGAWWGVGCAALGLMLLVEGGPVPVIDRLHPVHLLAWFGAGCVLAWSAGGSSRRGRWLRLVVGSALHAFAVLLAAAWARDFDWRHLSVLQFPDFARHRHVIEEYRSVADWSGGIPYLLRQVGLLPLGFLALPWLGERRAGRMGWPLLVAAGLVALSYDAVRWLRPASVVLAMVVPGAIAAAPGSPRRKALAALLIFCAPIAETLGEARRELRFARERPIQATLLPGAISALGRDLAAMHLPERPVILAPFGYSPYLLLTGQARTIGSQYWSNLAGMRAWAELTTEVDDLAFRRRLAERKVDFILIPHEAEQLANLSSAFHFMEFADPTIQRVDATCIRRLERTAAPLRVPTPELDRAAPGWNLVRAPR